MLAGRDPLEGVTSSKTNQEVTAWQQVTIEELPVVLILHLKCFDYKQDGCTKILKALEFPVELKIDTSKFLVVFYALIFIRDQKKDLKRLNNIFRVQKKLSNDRKSVAGFVKELSRD